MSSVFAEQESRTFLLYSYTSHYSNNSRTTTEMLKADLGESRNQISNYSNSSAIIPIVDADRFAQSILGRCIQSKFQISLQSNALPVRVEELNSNGFSLEGSRLLLQAWTAPTPMFHYTRMVLFG